MKTIIKKVYYCDFCKKHGLSSGSLKKHEKHCTNNPNRFCRICGFKGVPEKEAACPLCEFSRLRQNGTLSTQEKYFNLKERLDDYWNMNREQEEIY